MKCKLSQSQQPVGVATPVHVKLKLYKSADGRTHTVVEIAALVAATFKVQSVSEDALHFLN